MKKNEMIGFKTTTEVKKRLEEIANKEERSISYIINKIVTKHLEENSMEIKEVINILDEIINDIHNAEEQCFTTRNDERTAILASINKIKERLQNS